MLRAIGNFVVDLLDLQREVKFIGMLCIFFEKRIPFGLQVIPFFLPDSRYCQHVFGPHW
jgi:hypothetical protein